MSGPLQGLKVIDASSVLAGPLCAQILGDFGADVIKIEHPQKGDSFRTHGAVKDGVGLWWKMLARNKRCLGLYLGDPDGAAIFRELCADADVLIENFRPGTLERWGVGPEVLHADNPGLVITRVTGFGQTGPYASRPGFGTLIESMSGFAHATGEADGPPTLPPLGLADSIAGITAANATMMALYHRDAETDADGSGMGHGQVVDVSILEPLTTVMGPHLITYDQTGIIQQRTGNRSQNNAPRNTYKTSDDRWVAVSASANSIAERVMRLVGRPEIAEAEWFQSGAERARNADVIDEAVGSWIAKHDRAEVMRAFAEADAAVSPIYDASELIEDEHVVARGIVTSVPDPDFGEVRMQNVLFGLSETPGEIRWTGRALGADTDEILDAAGIAPDRVADLRARGVIA